LKLRTKRIAFTTDTYVVDPIFFPGGDIGSLAVYGTVNDLSVCGAEPLYISVGVVMEEGLRMAALKRITASIRAAADRAGVVVATGDTKVVGRGACDKIFINTSGVGEVYYDGLSVDGIRAGDAVILSGPMGDHGTSVMSKRGGFEFDIKVRSDSAPLNAMIREALRSSRGVRFMRDPTRGGVATTLNEIVDGAPFGISIDEDAIPVRPGVRQACEMLGIDPLYLACEGRAIFVVAKRDAPGVLRSLRSCREGRRSAVIGSISKEHRGRVYMNTVAGGARIVDMLSGEQLPRIC
jgi:hydrogenase expression/formation protein HypE